MLVKVCVSVIVHAGRASAQLHNEALTVQDALVTCIAACPPPFAYLLSCVPIVLLVSFHACVIVALVSPCLFMHIYEILRISSLLLIVRERTAVFVWIENSPASFSTSYTNFIFPPHTHFPRRDIFKHLNNQLVPDVRIDFRSIW